MNKKERALFKKLRSIKNDEMFVKAIMMFALNADCVSELIEAIDAGELQEEQDFYQLLQLVFEENAE